MKTNLRTIGDDDELALARCEMTDDEIRHLVVVDARGRVVGMLSDRDLLRARDSRTKVSEVMSRDVTTVTTTTPAAVAAERMLRDKHDALPILDEAGRLVGVLTSTDLLDLAYRTLIGLDPFAKHVHA